MKLQKQILDYLFLNKNPCSIVDIAAGINKLKGPVIADLKALKYANFISGGSAQKYYITEKGMKYCKYNNEVVK